MKQYATYISKAKKLGAEDAKIISTESVITAEWVRLKCQFGCGGYGTCLTCPPHSPTPEQTRNALSSYTHAVLVHGRDYRQLRDIVATLESDIFLDGYYKAFSMGAGPCELCNECPTQCRQPYRARPSMEACGIDVYSTVRNNGLFIEVVKDPDCECNYYGIVLIE
jgi:predicted metal-binding protein